MIFEPDFWGDSLRWVNIAVSMLVVALLIAGLMKRWHVTPLRYKLMSPWIVGTYVVIAYGSGEALASGRPYGISLLLLTCDLLGLIVALIYGLDEDTLKQGRMRDHLPWSRTKTE